MQNRRKTGNTLFTNQLIQLIQKYIPKNHHYSILKSFEEKSIKEQIQLLENYIQNTKEFSPNESDLIKADDDFSDPYHIHITEEKFIKNWVKSKNSYIQKRESQISEKQILKLQELISIEKFESDFNEIKKQYDKLFTHFVFKPTPSLCSIKSNATTTHSTQKPLGAKNEKTIEDLNESLTLNKAWRL